MSNNYSIKPGYDYTIQTNGGNDIYLNSSATDGSSNIGSIELNGRVVITDATASITNTASPYTIGAVGKNKTVILANSTDGTITINLPAVSAGTLRLIIADVGGAAATNNITITPNGGDKIQDYDDLVINGNYNCITLFAPTTGSKWFIL